MIVANAEVTLRHIRIKKDRLKPTILSLLLKIKKEYKKSFKMKISLYAEDRFLSKQHIVKTQKPTKILLTTHKLHSLHPFI